jgi:diguanylate cyclase (GGDEF)-like protein
MEILRVRNKLLAGAFAIATLVALASGIAVSFVIEQQNLNQANLLLKKAERDIQDDLQNIKQKQIASSERLASQYNFGQTIWYLSQYAKSSFNREILASSYEKLTSDIYSLGKENNLYKAYIYDAQGELVSFAVFQKDQNKVGYIERIPQPIIQIASLKKTENLISQNFQPKESIPFIDLVLKEKFLLVPQSNYVVSDGILAVETHFPIIENILNPISKVQEETLLGFISAVKALDEDWLAQISRLTDTTINIFAADHLSVGMLNDYSKPNMEAKRLNKTSSLFCNELSVKGNSYYQCFIPLKNNQEFIGSIALLYSKEIVQKNIREMRKVLALIALVCLLFIFPFAWYFSNTISFPISQLSRIFQDVAAGKNINEIDGVINQIDNSKVNKGELGLLTDSFVNMANSVRQKINEINDINTNLESRIEESTAQFRATNKEMEKLANADSLTGLHNRRAFFDMVNFAYSQSKRNNAPLSLIMLDLDHFKLINDQHGHPAGDEVLRCVARCLLETARESDYPARIGGEEFAILSTNTDNQAAFVLAERIRTEISFIRLEINGKVIPITASLGIASLHTDETFSQLYVRADDALYLAKGAGRNCTKSSG